MFQFPASVVDARVVSVDVQHPVMPYGLLGTPGNLELWKRMGVSGLNINNANLAGLMGDVDARLMCDAVRHDTLRASRV